MVCSDSLTSSSGSLSCNIPDSFGNVTVITKIIQNEEIITTRTYSISVDPQDIFGVDGTILVLILMMTIPLMFITSKIGMIMRRSVNKLLILQEVILVNKF